MKYLIAILVVIVFSLIFILSYYLNSKVKIDCDKKGCEGCTLTDCFYHKDGSEHKDGLE